MSNIDWTTTYNYAGPYNVSGPFVSNPMFSGHYGMPYNISLFQCPFCTGARGYDCAFYSTYGLIYIYSHLEYIPDFVEAAYIEVYLRKSTILTFCNNMLFSKMVIGNSIDYYFNFPSNMEYIKDSIDIDDSQELMKELRKLKHFIGHNKRGERRAKYMNEHGIYFCL